MMTLLFSFLNIEIQIHIIEIQIHIIETIDIRSIHVHIILCVTQLHSTSGTSFGRRSLIHITNHNISSS